MMTQLIIFFVIITISFFAFKIRALSKSGAVASVVVGLCIYKGFGMNGLILLGFFFGTSSFWSFFKGQQKKSLEENLEKGSQRDWIQVLANGGVAAITGISYFLMNDMVWIVAFLTSIASATGDTWSSEIGPLSKRFPISIRNFKVVQPGTSGAISLQGTIAALSGVCLIIFIGFFLFPITTGIVMIILIFGLLGNLFDTLLGAFYQRIFSCEICHIETEKLTHCNVTTKKIRGLSWLNNDGVNFLSSLLAPGFAGLTYLLIL